MGSLPDSPPTEVKPSGADGRHFRWPCYLLVVALSVATLFLRITFSALFGQNLGLILFVLPILLSAYIGGLWAGLLATVLLALGTGYFIIPPVYSLGVEKAGDALPWMLLILVGVLLSIVVESRSKGGGPIRSIDPHFFSIERKVQAGFAFALSCLAVIGVIAFMSAKRLSEEDKLVRHTELVIDTLRFALFTTDEADSALRGYIITGNESFRHSFEETRQQLQVGMAELQRLTADNPSQQRQLKFLTPIVQERISLLETIIERYRVQGFPAAQRVIAAGEGNVLQEKIHSIINDMVANEESLLKSREEATHRIGAIIRRIVVGGAVLAFSSVAVALFLIGRDFAGSRRAEAALNEANARLEERGLARTQELVQSHEAVLQSEARITGIVDSAMDAIISVDGEQKIILFNASAEKIFGCAAAEVIGKPLDRFIPGRFVEIHRKHVDEFSRTGVTSRAMHLNIGLSALRANGAEFSIEASISKIEVGGERICTVILRDITERKRAQEAAAWITAIVDSSFDAIVGKDMNGIVTSWNAGAERMFGYTATEMLGRSITLIIPPEHQKEEDDILAKIRCGETVEHFETIRRRKDGGLIDVSVTVSPIKDGDGRIIGASKVVRDITERKDAERDLSERDAEIYKLNLELEERVLERTAQLDAANKELEAFSYSVSHDLRAPLRAVDGFSQAVLEDYGEALPEQGRVYLRTIREGAQKMGMLIDDLLKFSRLSREAVSKQKINTTELVGEVLNQLNREWGDRQVDLHIGELPDCWGDQALLRQVWVNLLSNAFKYTRKREVTVVEIGCQRTPEDDIFYVKDNGIGFSMSYVSKLFGVFQRLHRAEPSVHHCFGNDRRGDRGGGDKAGRFGLLVEGPPRAPGGGGAACHRTVPTPQRGRTRRRGLASVRT